MDETQKREYRPFWILQGCIYASLIIGGVASAIIRSVVPFEAGGTAAVLFTIPFIILVLRWYHSRGGDLELWKGLKSGVSIKTRSPPRELMTGVRSKDPQVRTESEKALQAWAKQEHVGKEIKIRRRQFLSTSVDGGLPSEAIGFVMARCPSCNAMIPQESLKCASCGKVLSEIGLPKSRLDSSADSKSTSLLGSDERVEWQFGENRGPKGKSRVCLLYTSPSPRDLSTSRMPSSA